jgi:N-glycosylase/DNA lyase
VQLELELRGAGGEPVDLRRTVDSHGLTSLPPFKLDAEASTIEATLRLPRSKPRVVRVSPGRRGFAAVTVLGPAAGAETIASVTRATEHVLRLDEDLSPFYEKAATDPKLAWAAEGAGRMLRSQTVFEDVARTICTTNCTWSATTRMVTALVEHLGEAAAGSRPGRPLGIAFPTAAAMAEASDAFYRDVARAGYRGSYLRKLAADVSDGSLDLEALLDPELPDEEAERRLLALPGVGPYAAAHVMTMSLGRYRKLILDSWTRPKYAALHGRRAISDATIQRRFRRYGRYAGLAFWLTVTADWA